MTLEPARDSAIRRRVLRGTLANYGGRFVGVGTWFFVTPFVLHRLGAAGFGLWVLAAAIIGYGSLVDLGVTGAITKYVAEFCAQQRTHALDELIATGLLAYTVLGVLIALMTLLIVPFASQPLVAQGIDETTASAYVLLTGLTIALTIPCLISQAVLSGLHRFDLVSLSTTVGAVFSAMATAIALLAGHGLVGALAVNLATTLLVQLVNQWNVRRVAPELRFKWRCASWSMACHIASYSWSILVGRVAKRLKSKTDELEIAVFMPIAAVAPYALAHRLSDLAQNLADQFLRVLLPVASELHAQRDAARLRSLYLASTRLALAILVPLACTLMLLARPLLSVWAGPEYGASAYLVIVLMLAVLVDTSQWPATTILQGMARQRPVMLVAAASALSNLGLSILLVRPLGLTGIALGTLIPTLVENILFILPYSLRVMRVSATELLGRIVLPVGVPALPMLLLLFGLNQTLDLASWPALIVASTAGLLVYMTGFLVLGASPFERRLCREAVLGTVHFVTLRIASR